MKIQDTYENLVEIGAGGGGTVYKAYHVRMKKDVVLKKIHERTMNNVDIRREMDVLKNLRHTYLPNVLDFIEEDGSVYTVMDYIPGSSFELLLKQGKKFTQKQVVKYARQLSEVVTYLHQQNPPIIHGDIKPDNIILTPDDNICLIDFNISQLGGQDHSKNVGFTRGYAAPEQVIIKKIACEDDDKTELMDADSDFKKPSYRQPQNVYDARTDIYSIGATLYHLVSGKRPAKEFSDIKPIEEVVSCNEGLAYIINTCMNLDPNKRFQKAEDLTKAIGNCGKFDKRYRLFVLRQTLQLLICIMGLIGSIILCFAGINTFEQEQRDAYLSLVERIKADENTEEADVEIFFLGALKINKEYPEA